MNAKLDELRTIRQAADYVGVSRQTIYDWINSGFLGYIELGYGHKLIHKDALAACSELMRKRKRGGEPRRGDRKKKVVTK